MPLPGEHHFVAAYLVPKLIAITGQIPDYINPDGAKAVLGDIVYCHDSAQRLSIEVKLKTVRLTKLQFNKWVIGRNTRRWPTLFVGIGRTGIGLATWRDFRAAYIAAVRKTRPLSVTTATDKPYGPFAQVDQLARHLPAGAWFPIGDSSAKDRSHEKRFTDALHEYFRDVPTEPSKD